MLLDHDFQIGDLVADIKGTIGWICEIRVGNFTVVGHNIVYKIDWSDGINDFRWIDIDDISRYHHFFQKKYVKK
jgi:hypothetical protein